MKKIIVMLVIVILGFSLAAQPAFAGSKQRYRWQGVAIGVGAAILGHAILNNSNDSSCDRVTVYNRPCPPPARHGYWEVRRVWVEPKHKRVWNPAHYNRHGHWVQGRWQMIETAPGYYEEREVWVARR